RVRAATRSAEEPLGRKFRAKGHAPATFRVLAGLESTLRGMGETDSYERCFAYRLDEGAHRLRPFRGARPHQPPDGAVDAGLSDPRTAYRARPRARARRVETRRHSRLEHARRARLSPPRTRPGRPPQRVRRPDQQRGRIS